MPRKKMVTLDGIDVTLLPFQSRTTLGQYILLKLEERQKNARDMKESFACQVTLVMPEIAHDNAIVV